MGPSVLCKFPETLNNMRNRTSDDHQLASVLVIKAVGPLASEDMGSKVCHILK